MEIRLNGNSGGGLQATANAIRQAQVRFAHAADQVVSAAQEQIPNDSLVEGAPPKRDATFSNVEGPVDPASDLTSSVVDLHAESATNQILFGVFRRQADQQQSLLDLVQPR